MDMVPADRFREILRDAFDAPLRARGFDAVKPDKWVRSTKAPMRELVTLYTLKSLSAVPCWGFSLDFVPHLVRGDEIRWHRSPRSALMDLAYDPLDYTRDVDEWSVPRFGSVQGIQSRAEDIAARAISKADAFFARATTVEDVVALFEEMRTRPFVRFGFDNYPRNALAYAFTLASVGRWGAAGEWLQKYVTAEELRQETASQLEGLLKSATEQLPALASATKRGAATTHPRSGRVIGSGHRSNKK